ncbi:MAG: TetR family transcriptional regulator [Pseudomonadota bacterium]
MPRPKSYDRDEVILKAKDAFWEHGYQALGVRAIEAQTGLGSFALRTDFGGKEQLLLEALAAYREEMEVHIARVFDASDTVETIIAVLEQMVTPYPGSMRRFGCLMTALVSELPSIGSEPVSTAVDEHFQRIGSASTDLVKRAQDSGKAHADLNPHECGAFVVGVVSGLQIINRRAGRIDAAESFVEVALREVRRWSMK